MPQMTNIYDIRSFHSTAAKMWNSLPQGFREITSMEHFRSQIGTRRERACVCVGGGGGGWGGGGGLHMLVLFELLGFMFIFCCFNVESSVY